MTRSEWINAIGIAVATLIICFVVIQQMASVRSELQGFESRLGDKIDSYRGLISANLNRTQRVQKVKLESRKKSP